MGAELTAVDAADFIEDLFFGGVGDELGLEIVIAG